MDCRCRRLRAKGRIMVTVSKFQKNIYELAYPSDSEEIANFFIDKYQKVSHVVSIRVSYVVSCGLNTSVSCGLNTSVSCGLMWSQYECLMWSQY